MKTKTLSILSIFLSLVLISQISAYSLFPRPVVNNTFFPNTPFAFEFNFTKDDGTVLFSNLSTLTTDSSGIAFINLNIDFSQVPTRFIHWRNDTGIQVNSSFDDKIFNKIYVNNSLFNTINVTNLFANGINISNSNNLFLRLDQSNFVNSSFISWNGTANIFNETKLNNTISIEGLRLGFNSTFNATYDDKYTRSQIDNNFTLFTLISDFQSFFNSNFSAKTTDDLTEGSTNLYDNKTWNETRGNDLYLPHTIDTNATTECANGEYLDGSGSCINLNATISQEGITLGFNSTFNSTYDAKADYQFTTNNFNGSGNITTTGTINSTFANFDNITVDHIAEKEAGHGIVFDSILITSTLKTRFNTIINLNNNNFFQRYIYGAVIGDYEIGDTLILDAIAPLGNARKQYIIGNFWEGQPIDVIIQNKLSILEDLDLSGNANIGGTIDLGTNTISDGTMIGNWQHNNDSITNLSSILSGDGLWNITSAGFFQGDGSLLTGISGGIWTNVSGVATYATDDGNVNITGNLTIGDKILVNFAGATAPTYTFIGATDMGMSAEDSSNLIFSVGGSDKLKLSSTQIIIRDEGTKDAPVLSIGFDANTGLFHPTTDSLGLSAGGVEFIRLKETTQDILIFNENAVDVDFRVEGVGEPNALFVRGSDGNVGIGTTSPASELDVSGTITVLDVIVVLEGTKDDPPLSIGFDANTGLFHPTTDSLGITAGGVEFITLIEELSAQDILVFNQNGVDVDFRVEASGEPNALFVRGSDGNVGIGTTDPQTKLDVDGNITSSFFFGDGSQLTGISIFNSTYDSIVNWTLGAFANDSWSTTGDIFQTEQEELVTNGDMSVAGSWVGNAEYTWASDGDGDYAKHDAPSTPVEYLTQNIGAVVGQYYNITFSGKFLGEEAGSIRYGIGTASSIQPLTENFPTGVFQSFSFIIRATGSSVNISAVSGFGAEDTRIYNVSVRRLGNANLGGILQAELLQTAGIQFSGCTDTGTDNLCMSRGGNTAGSFNTVFGNGADAFGGSNSLVAVSCRAYSSNSVCLASQGASRTNGTSSTALGYQVWVDMEKGIGLGSFLFVDGEVIGSSPNTLIGTFLHSHNPSYCTLIGKHGECNVSQSFSVIYGSSDSDTNYQLHITNEDAYINVDNAFSVYNGTVGVDFGLIVAGEFRIGTPDLTSLNRNIVYPENSDDMISLDGKGIKREYLLEEEKSVTCRQDESRPEKRIIQRQYTDENNKNAYQEEEETYYPHQLCVNTTNTGAIGMITKLDINDLRQENINLRSCITKSLNFTELQTCVVGVGF